MSLDGVMSQWPSGSSDSREFSLYSLGSRLTDNSQVLTFARRDLGLDLSLLDSRSDTFETIASFFGSEGFILDN